MTITRPFGIPYPIAMEALRLRLHLSLIWWMLSKDAPKSIMLRLFTKREIGWALSHPQLSWYLNVKDGPNPPIATLAWALLLIPSMVKSGEFFMRSHEFECDLLCSLTIYIYSVTSSKAGIARASVWGLFRPRPLQFSIQILIATTTKALHFISLRSGLKPIFRLTLQEVVFGFTTESTNARSGHSICGARWQHTNQNRPLFTSMMPG